MFKPKAEILMQNASRRALRRGRNIFLPTFTRNNQNTAQARDVAGFQEMGELFMSRRECPSMKVKASLNRYFAIFKTIFAVAVKPVASTLLGERRKDRLVFLSFWRAFQGRRWNNLFLWPRF